MLKTSKVEILTMAIVGEKTLIIFNGPSGSGKDYIAHKYIHKECDNLDAKVKILEGSRLQETQGSVGSIVKFAQPIRDAAISTFDHITDDNFEDQKSVPIFQGGDITLRQWMIGFGETFMKPMLGDGIFGKIAAESVNKLFNTTNLIFITDGGFTGEVNSLIENIEGDVKFILVHLHRDGHDFANDSRTYINVTNDKVVVVELVNDGPIDTTVSKLHDIINK